jgi:hypothetical protein
MYEIGLSSPRKYVEKVKEDLGTKPEGVKRR